jgi:DNA modification methylase
MEFRILEGDCLDVLRTLPDASVHCCVTSPPYWGLRDYGCEGQMGLEQTPEEYVDKMVEVFREVRRVLRDDGTCWVNLGDSYHGGGGGNYGDSKSTRTHKQHLTNVRNRVEIPGLKAKDLVGIPWRVAFALQADGWWLRQDIIWHKPNPMPESVRDRCTKAHEYVFLLTKSERYFYDAEAVSEAATRAGGVAGGKKYRSGEWHPTKQAHSDSLAGQVAATRNRRSVWTVTTKPYRGAHFAVMPPDLVKPCILAGCPIEGTVLDPFAGSGTVAAVALSLGRSSIGIEINPQYVELAQERIANTIGSQPLLYNLEGE